MGDGSPNSVPYWTVVNRFTIYTPYSAWQIQNFLEKKVVSDKTSSTGFRKWNAATYTMDEVVMRAPYWTAGTADTTTVYTITIDAFRNYLQGLFDGGADIVTVQMGNTRWASNATAPAASANAGKYLNIIHNASSSTTWSLGTQTVQFKTNDQRSYLSDGTAWNLQLAVPDGTATRKPEFFGVPVTTLLGYYDPQMSSPSQSQPGWPGYIYPALHGAYGFVYPSESSTSNIKGCWLEVTLKNAPTRRYKLLNTRIGSTLMNKFQVNVPESEGATGATVICNATTLATQTLSPAKASLTYTVNGMPLPQ